MTSTMKEYRIQTPRNTVTSIADPHQKGIEIMHAYVPIRAFAHGELPDKVNPRSHERIAGRLPATITESLKDSPSWFHLLNRGLLILAEKAWYDDKEEMLHFTIADADSNGVADGGTTDRVLADIKRTINAADFDTLKDEEIPAFIRDASVHIEILSGDIGDMLVSLAGARNTSNQVKEFALENLGGGFDWLKTAFSRGEFKGRIRFRENDSEPVDVRTVLGLLTMFHPKWNELKREPVMAYTNKGLVLDQYRDEEWRPGYEALRPVAVQILKLYDYIHAHVPEAFDKYQAANGSKAKLSGRKEVRHNEKRKYTLPLTQAKVNYVVPDGWLYPMLAAFRMLLKYPAKGDVHFVGDPQKFFDDVGPSLVADVTEQSKALGFSAQTTGKSRPLWNALRKSVELRRMTIADAGPATPTMEGASRQTRDKAAKSTVAA